MTAALTRFWFALDYGPGPMPGPSIWCPGPSHLGVTAYDLADAGRLLASWFEGLGLDTPAVTSVHEGVDISTLPEHVRRHMNPPNWHGVWYPGSAIA